MELGQPSMGDDSHSVRTSSDDPGNISILDQILISCEGLSFLVDFRNAVSNDETLKFWNDTFMRLCKNHKSPYTVETTVAGQRIIMTADQENVKAILATQFDDFGKGKKFREDWVDMLGRSMFSSFQESRLVANYFN